MPSEEALDFWKEYLDSAAPLLEIITDRHRIKGSANDDVGGSVSIAIDGDIVNSLREVAGKLGTSQHTMLMVLWQLLLARYSRATDIVIGCAVSRGGNSVGGDESLVPVRLELETEPDKAALPTIFAKFRSVRDKLLNHAPASWSQLCPDLCDEPVLGDPTASYSPVFQAIFCMQDDAKPAYPSGNAFGAGSNNGSSNTVNYDLELHLSAAGNVSGRLLYRKSIFDELTITKMTHHFIALVEHVVKKFTSRWYDIPFYCSAERDKVIVDANKTSAPYPDTKCIHDLFEDQAIEHPNRPCLTFHDATSRTKILSYSEVYCRATVVANQLRRLGVGPDSPVPLILERSELQVIAIYGILLAGGCYVPIDADYPADRSIHMINDAGANIIISHSSLEHKLPNASQFSGTKILIDKVDTTTVSQQDIPSLAATRRRNGSQSPDTNVYIFYTSGTTGKPKGVEVTHRGLVKRAQWLQDFYPINRDDKVLYKTPYTFGISEWELFWAMPFGSQVVICKEGGQKDSEYLLQLTKEQKVTVCTYVPSMLAMLIEYMTAEGLNYSTDMKHVICCGEALPVETCYKFFEVFDPDITRLHNLYGPTEADMTYWECPKLHPGSEDTILSKIPIGKPMLNVKVYILDEWGNPVPAGVPGELHFGGVTTARGYLGLPELTNQKFVPNPFKLPGDCDRMYRTGDCARWLPDMSSLEFIGRVDNQIKLRGFRIELGEIESVIGSCEGVSKVAVIVHGKAAAARIIAYVEPKTIDPSVLVAKLKSKVPEYMIPSVILPLDSLPLTSRGKLDRKALPEPPMGSMGSGKASKEDEFVPAETRNQIIVERVWKQVLDRNDPISIHANFLSLGGNSLLAGRVTTQVRKQTGCLKLSSTAMYQHPTIAKIADLCDQQPPEDTNASGPQIGGNLHKPWGGRTSSSFRIYAQHGLGLLLESFTSTAAFLPAYMYIIGVYIESGKFAALRLLPLLMSITMVVVCSYTIFIKKFFIGKLRPGEYPVWGPVYMKWWLMHNLQKGTTKLIKPYVEETVLYNKFLTLLGASIGDRVNIDTEDVFDPDFITIDDDVEVGRKATIIAHTIENGILSLWPIEIGNHCRLLPVSWVTQGTRLLPGTDVGPLSTTGMTARDLRKGDQLWSGVSETENIIRVFLIVVILFMEALAYLPAISLLEWIWVVGLSAYPDTSNTKYALFCLVLPWVEKLVVGESFFLMTCLWKWIFIGRFKPGRREHTISDSTKRWFLARLTQNQQYVFATSPWINTELLAMKYRAMGVKMGFKVQTDFVDIIEFDLLEVGKDCVFGSKVSVNPTDHIESRKVIMQRSAQVLDHSTLMPGCIVGRGALCGSSTIGSKFYRFPPLSISTGNQEGKPVQLRVLSGDPNSAAGLSHLPPAEKEMALTALRNHQNDFTWGTFNVFNILIVMLIAPIPAIADLLTILLWIHLENYDLFMAEDTSSVILQWVVIVLVSPPVYFVVQVIELCIFIVFKWVVVGKYREGNFPFYGAYHRKWVIMMAVKEALGKLLDDLAGTPYLSGFFRIMGSEVGKDVLIMGYGLEYDLFHVGDYSTVGAKCDVTCHTVENMVIKLASTHLKQKCSMLPGALVQPGGVVLTGGVVMENGQVLKGGEVGEDQVYAGLPAEPCTRTLPELAKSQRVASSTSYHSHRRSEFRPYVVLIGFFLSLWFLPQMIGQQNFEYGEIKIKIPDGVMKGETVSDHFGVVVGQAFYGIPYADPPIDEGRWKPPMPVTPWSTPRASVQQPGCLDAAGGSEDCLYLDVVTPTPVPQKLSPVVVWFHAGCNSWSRSDSYNGKSLLNVLSDTVIVTVAHRVSALGFLSVPGGVKNIGLLDQRAALQWVKKNIQHFGGDPNSVTLFGQGSGAGSVAAHLVMKESYGLYHRAILQSMPLSALLAKPSDAADAQTAEVAKAVCSDVSSMTPSQISSCILKTPPVTLTSTGQNLQRCREGREGCSGAAYMSCGEQTCPWGFVVDGATLIDHPWRLLETGDHAKVPIIIGYKYDDGAPSLEHERQSIHTITDSEWRHWVEESFHPIPEDAVSSEYTEDEYAEIAHKKSNKTALYFAAVAARTDQLFGCTARRLAKSMSSHSSVFVYSTDSNPHSHLFFDQWNVRLTPSKSNVFDRALHTQVLSYWNEFIHSGKPGAGADETESVEWVQYSKENEETLQLQVPATMSTYPSVHKCTSVWDEAWLTTVSCMVGT
eukprot:TRINITY_DN667_c1_g2_i1.p1 TRINITY_DN667_c1_g2~~TRINITY_DN667_c1_g2_i1.p1  ORF type:complete len:2206 (+),score=387.95 TRINITY_DN667_c1_g2_i1:56-6673(+)